MLGLRRSEIEFKTGSILRKEMLQEIYEYPRVALEGLFSDYSDGILYGLEWKENEENHHLICPGALKLGGNIYLLGNELDVEKELGLTLKVDNSLKVDNFYRLCFVLCIQ